MPTVSLDVTQEYTQIVATQPFTLDVPSPTSVVGARDRLIVIITNPQAAMVRNINFSSVNPILWPEGTAPTQVGGSYLASVETLFIELWENDVATGWLGRFETYHDGGPTPGVPLTTPYDMAFSTIDLIPGTDEVMGSLVVPHDIFIPLFAPDSTAYVDTPATDVTVTNRFYTLSAPSYTPVFSGTVQFNIGSKVGSVDWFTDVSLSSGDVIQLRSDPIATLDSTFADMTATLVGCYEPPTCVFGSTELNISSVSYDGVVLNTQVGFAPYSLFMSPDGTQFFMATRGAGTGYIEQFTLSTPFDLSSASLFGSLDVTLQDGGPSGVHFDPSGTKMYMVGDFSDGIYQYTLGTRFDITTAVYDTVTITTGLGNPNDITMSPDGANMYITGNTTGSVAPQVRSFAMSTPFDISTALQGTSYDVTATTTAPRGVVFTATGNVMYMIDEAFDAVTKHTLNTAYDVTTASFDSTITVINEDSQPQGIFFSSTGTKMYIAGENSGMTYQYTIS